MSVTEKEEKRTKGITINIDFKMPRLGFDLKNTFNAKAIAIGLVAAAGVGMFGMGVAIVDAIGHWHTASPYTGAILTATGAGAALTGVWNAHAVGGQTAYKKPAVTALRNMFFMTATSVAPGALVAWGTSAVLSPVVSPVIGYAVGSIAGAAVNATSLKWGSSRIR
jgi:hypothetical protein